jgi:hypothetical protein
VDPRISLGLASAAGAFLGAGIMLAWYPDTGTVVAPAAAELPAPPPAAAAAAEEPKPAAADEGWGEPAGDDPFAAAAPADNPFGAPEGENPFGEAPPPPRVNPNRPFQPGGVVPEGGPYPSDVRGVGQVFRDRESDINDCMSKQGPAANPGELAVMLRLHLETDPGDPTQGVVRQIEAVQDKEGRYQYFLECASKAIQSAKFNAPNNGTSTVHWSVRR